MDNLPVPVLLEALFSFERQDKEWKLPSEPFNVVMDKDELLNIL